jgi:hypothetical protein
MVAIQITLLTSGGGGETRERNKNITLPHPANKVDKAKG